MNKTRARGLVVATLLAGLTLSGAVMADAPNFAGPYRIQHTTLAPANVVMSVLAFQNGQEVEHELECWLEDGIESDSAYCPGIDVSLPMQVRSEQQYSSIIGFDLGPLEIWAAGNNTEIDDVVAEYPPLASHAEWVDGWFWGGEWQCVVDEVDKNDCAASCDGVSSTSAAVYPAGTGGNPNSEPQCKVTCDCEGVSDWWIEPPAVQPMP